jgi:hypothetical protein
VDPAPVIDLKGFAACQMVIGARCISARLGWVLGSTLPLVEHPGTVTGISKVSKRAGDLLTPHGITHGNPNLRPILLHLSIDNQISI